MNSFAQRVCAHAGLLYAILLGAGMFGIAGWLPVPGPLLTADEVAAMFQNHTIQIRIGISVTLASSVLLWPFSAAIFEQMRRIEGTRFPFAMTQILCSTATVWAVMLPCYVWLAMAFRPELTPPGTLQLANDFAWFNFVGTYAGALIQCLAIGLCILRADPARSGYARWVGYFNIWVAILFLPGSILPFFKTGPFAWNGLIAFWLVAIVFFVWIVVMWWVTLRAIDTDVAPT